MAEPSVGRQDGKDGLEPLKMLLRSTTTDFLKVPPFPGARLTSLVQREGGETQYAPDDWSGLRTKIRKLRVGGTYWAAQPTLPERYRLVRLRDAKQRARAAVSLGPGTPIVDWTEPGWSTMCAAGVQHVMGPCDPWHMFAGADELICDCVDDVAAIAMLCDVPVTAPGDHSSAEMKEELRVWLRKAAAAAYINPFSDEPIGFEAALDLCGQWRRLIDSNRSIEALVGFAAWKRGTISPLLWSGSTAAPFVTRVDAPTGEVAIWRSKADPSALAALERRNAKLIEVEDGFIRSAGLGADCVPPLSIVVDRRGIYFDPSQPSDLERILENGDFPEDLLSRARIIRQEIVGAGITKYGVGDKAFRRPADGRRYLLVVGQVEDDRAVISGGGPRTNIELLQRVRDDHSEARIVYKPHPDVEAGHRRGAIDDDSILSIADEVIRDIPIASLIGAADEIHVNTSLAGFEALMRGKPVTTYGVPFYAGWGLTDDRGPVPSRRTARRALDELVAAALLLYPRYLDPVSGLPCTAEVLVSRLSGNKAASPSPIVKLRRFQGRMNRVAAAVRSRL